jgi:hypothetical protein
MGSGTPNHVNDPIVSGVWRPQDRYHYFVHDSAANIAAIGQFHGTIEDIRELDSLYRSGTVPPYFMLTSSYHIKPATITRAGGIAAIEDSVIRPVAALRDSGMVVPTNFTALVGTWQTSFNSRGYIYDARNPSVVEPDITLLCASFFLEECYPNPFNATTHIKFQIPSTSFVSLKVFDVLGREVATLMEGQLTAGTHMVTFEGGELPTGSYFVRLISGSRAENRKLLLLK